MSVLRRLLGLAVISIGLFVGLLALAGWASGGEGGIGLAIFFGVLSLILLIIGGRWARASARLESWRDDPATDRQKSFANDLGIRYSKNATKGELSDLISRVTGK